MTHVLLAAALSLSSLVALADGAVRGRVSDQSGTVYFNGATVRVLDTGIETVTANDGRFYLPALPAGAYVLEIHYVGATPVTRTINVSDGHTTTVPIKIGREGALAENIIVVGQAAGALAAINQVRAADNLVSVATADAIGQLPDDNVSEALQRISGVFIERDQGEGRFVGVRGLDPNLNAASINGLSVPAPESDRRSVALDVIPSDLVESLEVAKTLTPDRDADAIGGSIDIKSLTAFDRDGMSYKLAGQGYYNDLEQDDGYKVSGTFTNVYAVAGGELGVAFSASANQRNFGTDNLEADGDWERDEDIPFHEELEMRNYRITRERNGYALNLDFRADDDASYYLRSLYSNFSDLEYRNRIEFKLDEGEVSVDDSGLTATGTEMEKELKKRYEEQAVTSLLLGGENRLDQWHLAYSAGYSRASEDEPDALYSTFVYDSVERAGYRGFGSRPTLFYSDDARDAANYELDEISIENNYTEDEEMALRLDLKRDLVLGELAGHIKFGGKFRSRDKSRDLNALIYEDFDDAFTTTPTMATVVGSPLHYSLGDLGPNIDPALQERYIRDHIRGDSACGLADYDAENCDFILDEDKSRLASAADYRMTEDVTALYLMHTFDRDNLRVVYGLRYERTDFTADGFNIREVDVDDQEDVQVAPSRYRRDYSNLLPSINLRYRAAEDLILRAAYTHALARPSFGKLSPTPDAIEIEQDDGDIELSVEAGNPALEPYEAKNIDLALQYYPEGSGVISAGLFYKRIDNFIFEADVSSVVDPADYAGTIPVTDVEVFQPLNGDAADLYGLELGWTRQFGHLPAPFDGLLLMANATFTDSEADLGLGDGAGRDSDTRLPQQADTVANLVVGYEKYGWSLRLSSAYISERVREIDLEDSANDLIDDSHHQVDLTIKYDIDDHLQLSFSAINVNEAPTYRYYGSRRFNGQYDEIGRSFTLGISYRNF